MKKILSFLGNLLTDLFSVAKKEFNKLPVEDQNAMIISSGIVSLVNKMLDATPQQVRAAIQSKFPSLDEAKMEKAFFDVAKSVNLTGFSSFDDCVRALQGYLLSKQGRVWETVSHSLACLFAIAIGSPSQKVQALVSLMEYVYQAYIRPTE